MMWGVIAYVYKPIFDHKVSDQQNGSVAKSPTIDQLYGVRWGVETFFSRIKGRLCLENFTGKTVESVRQDFWSTVFISNFETLATEGIEDQINSD